MQLRTVAYLGGVDMEPCPRHCGRPLIFSSCSNLYRRIMGLLHSNQAQKKVRYFIETLISIDEFGPKNLRELCNDVMAQTFKCVQLSIYRLHEHYFTNRNVVIKKKMGRSKKLETPS